MEKFRKFGDAATGVNPFTFVIAPTTLGRVGASVMYPMRLLFCTLFFLLLLLVDLLSYLLYCLYFGFLGRWLVGPLQRLLLRALLFFHGHLIPVRQAHESAGAVLLGGKGASSSSASSTMSLSRPAAGDVVVCNMQSVWDDSVLTIALAQPYHVVAFPIALDPSVEGEGDIVQVPEGAAKRARDSTTEDPVAYEDGDVRVKVFWPGPLQRWRVWRYVRRTGTLAFLQQQKAALATSQAGLVNVMEAQRQARRAGVPVLYFAEGTCSNGKGLLKMPPMRLLAAVASEGGDKECVVWTAMTQYDTPALQNVVSEGEGALAFFFRAGVLLYGSTNANWASPFFPRAEVLIKTVTVPTSSGARCLRRLPDADNASAKRVAGAWPWEFSVGGIDAVRTGMCQRPKSAVVATSGGASAGPSNRRHALSVGIAEKVGFVETYMAM